MVNEANPENSLRFLTHWSTPLDSALACSGGPHRRTSACPTSVKDHTLERADERDSELKVRPQTVA